LDSLGHSICPKRLTNFENQQTTQLSIALNELFLLGQNKLLVNTHQEYLLEFGNRLLDLLKTPKPTDSLSPKKHTAKVPVIIVIVVKFCNFKEVY
jgi:hypothetical protein